MSMKLEQQQSSEPTSDLVSLLTPFPLGALSLPNRIVMSPMTCARSKDGVPADIEGQYYSQRALAGLIITGGIYISPMAVGGINVPGIYTDQQIDSWQRITEAVHSAGGRIFAQLSHSGSVSHPSLLNGDTPVAPSAVNPRQKVMSARGYVDTVEPRALMTSEIRAIVEEYRTAAVTPRRPDSTESKCMGPTFTCCRSF
jgi:N-ethylmaleimide reductase